MGSRSKYTRPIKVWSWWGWLNTSARGKGCRDRDQVQRRNETWERSRKLKLNHRIGQRRKYRHIKRRRHK